MDTEHQQANLIIGAGLPGGRRVSPGKPRSLPIVEWPISDRFGWTEACRPAQRLSRGGAGGHLSPVSQADIARRYGLYLDYLKRNGQLDPKKGAINFVTS